MLTTDWKQNRIKKKKLLKILLALLDPLTVEGIDISVRWQGLFVDQIKKDGLNQSSVIAL